MQKIAAFLLFLGLFNLSYAIEPGKWQCTSYDAENQLFVAQALNLQKAMHKAIRLCKNKSKYGACKTAQSFCQQGPISLIDDRCIATDDSGWTWNTSGRNACKTALSLCNQWAFKNGTALGTNCVVRHR